jgi:hypothetical protein
MGLNEKLCVPPLSEDEVRKICLSACGYIPDNNVEKKISVVDTFIRFKSKKINGESVETPNGLFMERLSSFYLSKVHIYKIKESNGEKVLIYNKGQDCLKKIVVEMLPSLLSIF